MRVILRDLRVIARQRVNTKMNGSNSVMKKPFLKSHELTISPKLVRSPVRSRTSAHPITHAKPTIPAIQIHALIISNIGHLRYTMVI